jgi:methanogenic corrinoid protein MtbC1
MAGLVIPEPVYTRADYDSGILERLYEQMAHLDPEGLLRHEFANARGAIARFERGDWFVPEMLVAGKAMAGALDLLRPLLAQGGVYARLWTTQHRSVRPADAG